MLEEWLRELREGDLNALDKIYGALSRGVFVLAFSILRDREKAKDILQDTFVRVYTQINKYKSGNGAGWIMRIARNLSYREYNKGKKLVFDGDIDQNVYQSLCEDFSGDLDLWTGKIDLDNALLLLSNKEREIVTLFSIGFKHREIALIVKKPLGTVLWTFNKAIKKLKEYLSEVD